MTRMTHCDSSVPTVGHSFFEALLPLVIIRTSPSSYKEMLTKLKKLCIVKKVSSNGLITLRQALVADTMEREEGKTHLVLWMRP